jgi:hypothetical protein
MDSEPFITHLLEIKIHESSIDDTAERIVSLLSDVAIAHKVSSITAILKWGWTGEGLRFYLADCPYTDSIVSEHVKLTMIEDIVANIKDETLQVQFLITKPLFNKIPIEHWIISSK